MVQNIVCDPPAGSLQSPTTPNIQNFASGFYGSSSRGVLKDDLFRRVQCGVVGLAEKIIMGSDNSAFTRRSLNIDKYVKELRNSLKSKFQDLSQAISEHDERACTLHWSVNRHNYFNGILFAHLFGVLKVCHI